MFIGTQETVKGTNMKKLIRTILFVGLIFTACKLENINITNEDNIVTDQEIAMIFATEMKTILIFRNTTKNLSRSHARKNDNDQGEDEGNYSYKIQNKDKGNISTGNVTIVEDDQGEDTLEFESDKGKSFNAKMTKTSSKRKLVFNSQFENDSGELEDIGTIEEATLFIAQDNVEFPYLIKIDAGYYEVGFKDANGSITFLRSQIGGVGSLMPSLGSHRYLYYTGQYDEGTKTVELATIKIVNWVPPYKGNSILSETMAVAQGTYVDDRGILSDAIFSNWIYEEKEVPIKSINRRSMFEGYNVYENHDNIDYPYLLDIGLGFRIGISDENETVHFLPYLTIAGNYSHDVQVGYNLGPGSWSSNWILVAFDWIDHTHQKVGVYFSKILPASPGTLATDYISTLADLDARILNNTTSGYYSYYEYSLIDSPPKYYSESDNLLP